MRHMTYDMTKPSRKNKFLQNFDFLFVYNAYLIIHKENFLFVIISVKNRNYYLFVFSVENRVFIQIKNLKKTLSYKNLFLKIS